MNDIGIQLSQHTGETQGEKMVARDQPREIDDVDVGRKPCTERTDVLETQHRVLLRGVQPVDQIHDAVFQARDA